MTEDTRTNFDARVYRYMEVVVTEVFLDFDPVFPGWPPDQADARRDPRERLPEQRVHGDPRAARRSVHDGSPFH